MTARDRWMEAARGCREAYNALSALHYGDTGPATIPLLTSTLSTLQQILQLLDYKEARVREKELER